MPGEVRAAIARLPTKQRATLILRVYHELPHEEIADMLGSSVGAVKANFFHALANLQEAAAGPVMRHLSPDQLIAFIEDPQTRDLTPQERRHVEQCAACQSEATAMRALLTEIREEPGGAPSPLFWDHFAARVADAIRGEAPEPAVEATAWRFGGRTPPGPRLPRQCCSGRRWPGGRRCTHPQLPVLWLPPGTPSTQKISKTTRRGRWCAPPPTDCRGKTCRLRELPPAPAPLKGS